MHESVVSEMQNENWLLKGDLEERKHADPKNTPSTEGLDRQYRDQGKWKQNPKVKVGANIITISRGRELVVRLIRLKCIHFN